MKKIILAMLTMTLIGIIISVYINAPKQYRYELPESKQVYIPPGTTVVVTDPAEIAILANENELEMSEGTTIEKIELEYSNE